MCAFEAMLSKGPRGEFPAERGVVLLSARPEEFSSGNVQNNPLSASIKRVHGQGLRDALLGKLLNNAFVSETARFQQYAVEKENDATSFIARADIVKEDNCNVFVGDNGQGDLVAGLALLQRQRSFAAVFIHVVNFYGEDATKHPKLKPSARADRDGVHFFRTAVGAALAAHCHRMIPRAALRLVVADVRRSPQRTGCITPCQPDNCIPLIDKCSDENCNADPDTGFAPGCSELLCELRIADDFLFDRLTCAQLLPMIDATPAYAGDVSAVSPKCESLTDMSTYEARQISDTVLLNDPLGVRSLTNEETQALDNVVEPAPSSQSPSMETKADEARNDAPSTASKVESRLATIAIAMIFAISIVA